MEIINLATLTNELLNFTTRINLPSLTLESKELFELREQNIPIQPFIDFHNLYGGLVTYFGSNRILWGIIYTHPEWRSPMKAEVEIEAENGDPAQIVCADVHPSDSLTMDSSGHIYWSYQLNWDSFEAYLREEAFLQHMAKTFGIVRLWSQSNYPKVQYRKLERLCSDVTFWGISGQYLTKRIGNFNDVWKAKTEIDLQVE